MNHLKRLVFVVLVACAAAGLLAGARPAHATPPGANGRLAFLDTDGLETLQPPGHVLTTLLSDIAVQSMDPGWAAAREPAYSPDGSKIAFSMQPTYGNQGGIFVANSDGTGITRVTSPPVTPAFVYAADHHPTWSPDGRQLAFARAGASDCANASGIWIVNADGSGERELTPHQSSPSGRQCDQRFEAMPAWSPDGSKIAFKDGDNLDAINPDGTGQSTIVNIRAIAFTQLREFSWSPDGSQLALGLEQEDFLFEHIWVIDASGANATQLTTDSADVHTGDPEWSPDGTQIAFMRQFGTGQEIWVMDRDGRNQQWLRDAKRGRLSWQPLGVVPSVNTPAGTNIAVQPLDYGTGTSPVKLTFTQVTSGGDTTVVSSTTGAPPPVGFRLGLPPTYYELKTTASFTGSVLVCIDYSGIAFPLGRRLFHFDGAAWNDVTTSDDPASHTICGTVTSLSPFAIMGDGAPPTLTVPASLTVEATGPGGADVTYVVSTTDNLDPAPAVDCAPASGATFALGATTVHCTAIDASANQASAAFDVNVVDTTPPRLTLPSTITVDADSPAGAAVSFSVVATDVVAGSIVPTCLPASGGTFAIGKTTVTCSAADVAGNSSSGRFDIVVAGAAPQLRALIVQTAALTVAPVVKQALGLGLSVALGTVNAGKPRAACVALAAYALAVHALDGRAAPYGIPHADAARLITSAVRIRSVLGC